MWFIMKFIQHIISYSTAITNGFSVEQFLRLNCFTILLPSVSHKYNSYLPCLCTHFFLTMNKLCDTEDGLMKKTQIFANMSVL